MTYRERREARVERLRGWAEKRENTATATINTIAERYRGDIAFNTQPGHIPERARVIAHEERAFASLDKAQSMNRRADGIEHQLATSIFSDDPDAIEALEAKIAALETKQERMKAVNKQYAKAIKDGAATRHDGLSMCVTNGLLTQEEADACERSMRFSGFPDDSPARDKPFPGYATTNNNANIRRLKSRIDEIKRRQSATAEAEAAGGVTVKRVGTNGEYTVVTFAEKPERVVLEALRAAGFCWGGGSWSGPTDKLPAEIKGDQP